MKKLLFFFTVFISNFSFAQGGWIQKANFTGNRVWAVGFSIGNKGYMGTGVDYNASTSAPVHNDFWEYDLATNVWTQKANFTGNRVGAVGFSIGSKGYMGTGVDYNASTSAPVHNDFWEFNPCYPFDTARICMVTVDSLSNYNIIVWDKTLYPKADSFIIYREYTTNNYVRLGAVSKDSLSLFIDTVRTKYFPITGDPNVTSYRYKLQILNKCGDYSQLGPYHNTVHMVNNSGNFSWNFYEVENTPNPVTFYELKRDNFSNGNWITVAGVSGSQNAMTDPQYSTWQATANYRIATQWNISCTPTLMKNPEPMATTINSTKSNTFKIASPTAVNETSFENTISIYPNPTNGEFKVQSSGFKIQNLEIENIVGEKVYSQIVNSNSHIVYLDVPSGIYFLKVISDKGAVNKKIIIAR